MKPSFLRPRRAAVLLSAVLGLTLVTAIPGVEAADQALLDILLGNGVITQEQYDSLMNKESIEAADILGGAPPTQPAAAPEPGADDIATPGVNDVAIASTGDTALDRRVDERVTDKIAQKIEKEFPVKASYGDKGFRLETRDGNWQTNLQWRAQLRYTNPYVGDPRQLDDFGGDQSTFEGRRLRMKIGGHGYQPWLKYYFEVDLQPSRDVDDDSSSASARVIDWRIDVARWDWAALRVGQWKIDHNRERVDSSGRQEFVERSIVNRIFTIDRQVGVQLRGHLFENTPADMRYYAGVYTGEGRGVVNNDEHMMYAGRLQWNFLGRDLAWRQTDVEYTEQPTGSVAFGAMTNIGPCTRWSSGGCGNLDGFTRPSQAGDDQFKVDQMLQEFAFKYRGLALQQEFHWKTVEDRSSNTTNDFTGAYAQAGYFFHHLFPLVPAPLELAFRYAFVKEPNEFDRALDNLREEYTLAANWFFSGHNNKLTLDLSHLTLDDELVNRAVSDDRVRFQWDVSF